MITADGRLDAGIRKAALASGASPETISALLPASSEEGGHASAHVHVPFRRDATE